MNYLSILDTEKSKYVISNSFSIKGDVVHESYTKAGASYEKIN